MKNKTLIILVIFLIYGFTNEHYSINLSKSWDENPKMFSSDVMFTTQIVAKKAPQSLYVKTYDLKVENNKASKFIIDDLKKQASDWKGFKLLENGTLKTILQNKEIYYATASFMEDGSSQKIFVAILPNKAKYHYFMFQAEDDAYSEYFPEIENAIKRIKIID